MTEDVRVTEDDDDYVEPDDASDVIKNIGSNAVTYKQVPPQSITPWTITSYCALFSVGIYTGAGAAHQKVHNSWHPVQNRTEV